MTTPSPRILKSVPYRRVPDLPRAVAFYTDQLGFEAIQTIADTEGRPFFVIVRRGEATQMLSSRPVHHRDRLMWIYVDNVDAAHRELVIAGADIPFPPTDQPHGNREFLVEDPAGETLVFAQILVESRMLEGSPKS
ncbi:MAG: hypothetical protein CMJ31_13100 [Phycisphaerae bacterium]|nr:hypothetical protein [Phycisphaerae bacterium]|tara:strand:- start:199 stop:606 length:408 start_codon:yes stop_codon:yes gene_type:complete